MVNRDGKYDNYKCFGMILGREDDDNDVNGDKENDGC